MDGYVPTPEDNRLSQELVKLPENIVICIDISDEMDSEFKTRDSTYTRWEVVKEGVKAFILRKASFNRKHRFGFCTLGNEAAWVLPFTDDLDLIMATLESLTIEKNCSRSFDFSNLLASFAENLRAEGETNAASSNPSTIYRAVIIYGRSYEQPSISLTESQTALMDAPGYFLDLLYIHKKASEAKVKCQEIYDTLTQLESQSPTKHGYFFETSTSIQRLYMHLTMLLAHPAQRNLQEEFVNKVLYQGPNEASSSNVVEDKRNES
eukprot:CAMPEP_0117759610 /NCGR_PEP_ID=MMETSP0947-20121206/16115_1 /TAXON_ID=44440 /ORGANISM="Chattonella subsalsa, Strain CCMP2191" /LENGTH=264 /DNA_ID=CAMNT_0005580099 /DNA_START=34 /DNA_END=828 /DNA_ORIENTATION=+